MNKIISYVKKYPLWGVAVVLIGIVVAFIDIEWLRRCYMMVGTFISAVATVCMACIAYEGNKQGKENAKIAKASAEAAQRQAEAATEQTKAIQQQIEISKQQAEAAKQQVDIAKKELEETQKQREEIYRPRLIVYFAETAPFTFGLVVENVGNAPTWNIRITVRLPWEQDKSDKEQTGFPRNSFESRLGYLAPGKKEVLTKDKKINFYTCTPIQLFLMHTKPTVVNFEYHGSRQPLFEKTSTDLYLSNQIETIDFDVSKLQQPEGVFDYLQHFIDCFKQNPISLVTKNLSQDWRYALFLAQRIHNEKLDCGLTALICNDFINANVKIEEDIKLLKETEAKNFYHAQLCPPGNLHAFPLHFLIMHFYIKNRYNILKEYLESPEASKREDFVVLSGMRQEKHIRKDVEDFLREIEKVLNKEDLLENKLYNLFKMFQDGEWNGWAYCYGEGQISPKLPMPQAAHVIISPLFQTLDISPLFQTLDLSLLLSEPSLFLSTVREEMRNDKPRPTPEETNAVCCLLIAWSELKVLYDNDNFDNVFSLDWYLEELGYLLVYLKKVENPRKKEELYTVLERFAVSLFRETADLCSVNTRLHYAPYHHNQCKLQTVKDMEASTKVYAPQYGFMKSDFKPSCHMMAFCELDEFFNTNKALVDETMQDAGKYFKDR